MAIWNLNNINQLTSTISPRLASPTTVNPSLTRALQMATPIPALAPVTTATRPFHLSISFGLNWIVYYIYLPTRYSVSFNIVNFKISVVGYTLFRQENS